MANLVGDLIDVKTKNDFRSKQHTQDSLSPLTWLLTLFSINNNVVLTPCSKVFYIFKSLITIIIIGLLDIYSLYYKYEYIYQNVAIGLSVQFTDSVQTIYDMFLFSFDFWFVFKYGRDISMPYFRQYECIDEILGMPYYSEIKSVMVKQISIFTFVCLVTTTCDWLAWYINYDWIVTTTYAPAYIFIYLKILASLDLSSHVIQINYRLMIIGDYVYNYYSAAESLSGFMDISQKNWLYASICSQKNELKPTKLKMTKECSEINWLTRCYLQLLEQVEFINCMFGYRILLNNLSLLIDIIRFTNIAVRIILGTVVVYLNSVICTGETYIVAQPISGMGKIYLEGH